MGVHAQLSPECADSLGNSKRLILGGLKITLLPQEQDWMNVQQLRSSNLWSADSKASDQEQSLSC
jgi:hypothetical protein